MRRRLVRLLVCCIALLSLVIVGDLLFFSPYFPFQWDPKVPPAQISRSAPNREGLITAARPLVTQIAPGDPLGVAIHWQRPDDAISFNDGIFFEGNSDRLFLPRSTINTITFTLTSPDGTVSQGRVTLWPGLGDETTRFPDMPGLVLEIDSDGLELLAPRPDSASRLSSPWREGKSLQFENPGAYRLGIRGRIVCYGSPPMEFAAKPMDIEVLPGIKTNAALRDRAEYIIVSRLLQTALPANDIVADDEAGNRHFAFRIRGIGKDLGWRAGFIFRPDGALLRAQPRVGGGCIAVGTFVETPRGPVPIESLQPGDQVVSLDLNSKRHLLSTVRHAVRSRARSTIQIGDSLRTTAEHPIWANGNWKRADEVEVGDTIMTESGASKIGSISRLTEAIDVIDLDVGEPHNYFAGGILVHNKDIKPPPRYYDYWYRLPGVPAPPRD